MRRITFDEPQVTINGVALTSDQVIQLRIAVDMRLRAFLGKKERPIVRSINDAFYQSPVIKEDVEIP